MPGLNVRNFLKKKAETQTAKGILKAVYTITKATKSLINLRQQDNKGTAAATGGNILVLNIQSAKKNLL